MNENLANARNKIVKPAGEEPTELELKVAESILDLELNVNDLKVELRPLQISAAKEIDIGNGKKAIIVFVPVPLLRLFRKIQARLIQELEKKFSDRHFLVLAQRRIVAKETRKSRAKQARPRSRTLTSVHENILEDMVYPTEIVGKRIRVKVDGHKTVKVHLDRKDSSVIEYKLDTFTKVYKKLTGKDVSFEFPVINE